jgi:hypothetical protein
MMALVRFNESFPLMIMITKKKKKKKLKEKDSLQIPSSAPSLLASFAKKQKKLKLKLVEFEIK